MNEDAEKLKNFRKREGLTQAQLANKLDVKQQIIAMTENGSRQASAGLKLAFIKVYGIDFDTQIASGETLSYETFEKLTKEKKCSVNIVPIPFYEVKAAAGSGIALPDYPDKDVIYFDKRWLKNIIGINPENASIITARGDSMDSGQNKSGDIRDGDLLMVDNSIIEIINNRIFVLQINNELLVKRVIKELDGTISLISANPVYSDRIIQECDAGCIIGKVVWNGSKENI